MKQMDGKVLLVTGTTSGMGWDAAKLFAREGAAVIAVGRRVERGEKLINEITADGGKAVFVPTDITDDAALERLFAFIKQEYGRLDGAMNNAGVEGGPAPLPDMPISEYDRLMDTNARATWMCMRHEMGIMREQRAGAIVNISSGVAMRTYPNSSAYVASKHAVVGMTKSAAMDGAEFGVRVNCILPGAIFSEMVAEWVASRHGGDDSGITYEIPMGRFGLASEISEPTMFLLSDQASYITGACIPVDGGITLGSYNRTRQQAAQ